MPGAYCELLVDGVNVGMVPVEDISPSGVFVAYPRPSLALNTRVTLHFVEEDPPLEIAGNITQVAPPGGTRTAGYGIGLELPQGEIVATPAPAPVVARTSAPVSLSTQTTTSDGFAAVILGAPNGTGPAMAQSLSLFGVATLFSADPRSALLKVDRRTRVVFAELALLDGTGASIAQVRSAAEKARVIVAVDALPGVDVRARLLRQGADELLLPSDPFNVMRNIHSHARREKR